MLAKSPRDRFAKLPKVFEQSLLGLALLTWTAYGPETLVHAQP
ncbi:MAG: hypothetical protein RLZZ396_232, partial [Planctomycetota bacterium]